MARSMSRLVFTPRMCVSFTARRALRTQSFHEEAVMMSFATRLSKSEVIIVEWLPMRCVSTRTPLPVGNSKDVILPMDNDQLLCTFSAVIRSWMEWAGGGVSGARSVVGNPQFCRLAPCASRSWAWTMSVVEMDSVIVCSTCRRGFTSRK